MKHKLPVLFMIFGGTAATLAIFADHVGLGQKGGIPAMQILAAEIGILILLLGVGLFIYGRSESLQSTSSQPGFIEKLANQPAITWVVLGFLIAYTLFYIFPTFINEQSQFQYATGYLPPREHIGFDTRLTLDHIRVWFLGEREPKYLFPALATILFTPLLLLRYPFDFYVVTAITLVSYLFLNLFIPLWIGTRKNRGLILFIFAISVFSYGLQFELETGQFYTTAMMLTATAIYIFHRHPRYRIFAYILFCISVQLKLFPAIFIVMLVDDWRDWKTIIKRFAALGAANFALLFLLGSSYFSLFFSHLVESGATDELAYNHSIFAFSMNTHAADWLENLLYGYFLVCFVTILGWAYLQNKKGINVNLWMACLIGGLMLPAISHDYKLPLLMAPFMMVMSAQSVREGLWAKIFSNLLIVAASFAYSATLFPSTARTGMLENSFPFLFVLLTAVFLLDLMPVKTVDDNN